MRHGGPTFFGVPALANGVASHQVPRLTAGLTRHGGPIIFGFLGMANGMASCYGSQLRHASFKLEEAKKCGAYRRPHETFAAEALRDRPVGQ
ncbi:hypothetical protein CI102_6086 [Trichoderma harzianum]|nr:hypothetical protein CI102_6086 [Trichoderma harzianum]